MKYRKIICATVLLTTVTICIGAYVFLTISNKKDMDQALRRGTEKGKVMARQKCYEATLGQNVCDNLRITQGADTEFGGKPGWLLYAQAKNPEDYSASIIVGTDGEILSYSRSEVKLDPMQ